MINCVIALPAARDSTATVVCWQPAFFFSKGRWDERLVIANANDVGRVEKKARQGGMVISSHFPLR